MKIRSWFIVIFAGVAICLNAFSSFLAAQSGSRVQIQNGSGTRRPSGSASRVQNRQIRQQNTADRSVSSETPFEVRFWNYLQRSNYKNWAPGPGQSDEYYEGQSPHGAYVKLYLNRAAIANSQDPPHRSVIVKENYAPDRKTLMAITVMYRASGFDPQHRDWYWVKYNPDGSVASAPAAKGGGPLRGKVAGCIQCHEGADGNDFVFLND